MLTLKYLAVPLYYTLLQYIIIVAYSTGQKKRPNWLGYLVGI